MKSLPPQKGGACSTHSTHAPDSSQALLAAQNKSTHTIAQAQEQDRQQRAIGLLWISAKTLIRLDQKLTDLATLAQQEVDLLRRLLKEQTK